jgi:hypothetical protein
MLASCVPEPLREALLGDLHEEFVGYVRPSRSSWRAWWWYVAQVFDSLVPVLALWVQRGFGHRIARAVGLGAFLVAGPLAGLHWLGDFARSQVPLRTGLVPDDAYLYATLLAGVVAIAVGSGVMNGNAEAGGVQTLLLMFTAPMAVTAVLDLSPAAFPLWYRVAWLLVAPCAASVPALLLILRRPLRSTPPEE